MSMQNTVIQYASSEEAHFKMIDVGRKRPTRRLAIASGRILMGREAFESVKNKTLPKGDVLALAECAGITGAKFTPNLIPMCHTLPLDQATIHFELDEDTSSVVAYAQAVAFAKTGVEMEALAGVNTALLTVWDLVKGVDANLQISDIKLLVKTGGKSGIWTHEDGIPKWLEDQLPSRTLQGIKAGVMVMSDRASSGVYEDESGHLLVDSLKDEGATVEAYEVIPDDGETIGEKVEYLCTDMDLDILILSGGTGPGPRDVTPEALAKVSDRMLDGLGDVIRAQSLYLTDTAWLSRSTSCMVGSTFVVALPGSPKAVKECWDILIPFLGDTLNKIKKQGFERKAG